MSSYPFPSILFLNGQWSFLNSLCKYPLASLRFDFNDKLFISPNNNKILRGIPKYINCSLNEDCSPIVIFLNIAFEGSVMVKHFKLKIHFHSSSSVI